MISDNLRSSQLVREIIIMQLERFVSKGLELLIDKCTGEVFASQNAVVRMCDTPESTLRGFASSHNLGALRVEIPTEQGVRMARLYTEDEIYSCLQKYNPKLLVQCAKAGLRVYLHQLAGFKVGSSAVLLSPNELILSKLDEVLTRLDVQEQELKLFRPAYEELQTLNKSFDELRNLKSLLENIAKVIDKPNQKTNTLRGWLKSLSLDNAVDNKKSKAIGRLIADWLKIGQMDEYVNNRPAKYPEAMVPLIKLATEYQLFHA